MVLRAASVPAPTLSGSEDTVVRKNCTTLMQRGLRGCTRREVGPVRSVPRLCLIGLNVPLALGRASRFMGGSGSSGPKEECGWPRLWWSSQDRKASRRCSSVKGIIQFRHSRRSAPINFSQSEFAFAVRTGVSITSRPRRGALMRLSPPAFSFVITDGLDSRGSGFWTGIAARVSGEVRSPKLLAGRLEPERAPNRAVRDRLRGAPVVKLWAPSRKNDRGAIPSSVPSAHRNRDMVKVSA